MAKAKKEEKEVDFLGAFDALINSEFNDVKDLSKDDTNVPYWLNTGNYALNYACSKNLKGGIPGGRSSSFIGLSGTGKSLLMAGLCKDPQIDRILVFSAEGGGISKSLFDFVGCKPEHLAKIKQIPVQTIKAYKIKKEDGTIEEVADKDMPDKLDTPTYIYKQGLLTMVRKILNNLQYSGNKTKLLILIDGFTSLKSIRQFSGGEDMGKSAKDYNDFFNYVDNAIENTNACLVFTNKVYTKFGDEYDPWKAAGGESVVYNPSLNIMLTSLAASEDLTDAQKKAEKERRKTALGNSFITVRANIKKSRFGTNGRNAHFLIDANNGIIKYSGLFEMLKDFKIITSPTTGWYTIEGVDGLDGNWRKADFIPMFREKEEFYIEKFSELLAKKEEEFKVSGDAEINDLGETVSDGSAESSANEMLRAMEAQQELAKESQMAAMSED